MKRFVRLLPWLMLALLLTVLVVSWSTGGIAHDMTRHDLSGEERVSRLKLFFDQAGMLAPVLYVICVTIEVVVAPIPGLFLYAPGGLIFGPWTGGALAIIGNVLGAGISCAVAREVGLKWLGRIAGSETMERLQECLERRGFWLIVLLRLNPVTSNDLLSYAAGFTRIPVYQVMLATGIGMTPLCLAQSWLSDSVFNRYPQLLWPLLGIGLIYVVAVVVILSRLLRVSTGPDSDQAVLATADAERPQN